MTDEVIVLAGTAAGIGFIHTILGPDHYVPFIVMSKARGWSGRKTAIVTSLCGLGHVVSSILLGIVGLFLGIVVFKLESIESFRGDLAGWLLMTFGFVYLLWESVLPFEPEPTNVCTVTPMVQTPGLPATLRLGYFSPFLCSDPASP